MYDYATHLTTYVCLVRVVLYAILYVVCWPKSEFASRRNRIRGHQQRPSTARCAALYRIRGPTPLRYRGTPHTPQSRRCRTMSQETTSTADDTSTAEPIIPPIAATTLKWHNVVVKRDAISIIGGLSSKLYILGTIDVFHNAEKVSFVEVSKNADWFLKMVGGNGCVKGGCKAVRVIQELHAEVVRIAGDGQPELDYPPPAVDDAAGDVDGTGDAVVDPMDALDGGDIGAASSADKPLQPPRRKLPRYIIVPVNMPLRPICADKTCTATRTVHVYYSGKNGKKLHVRSTDLTWLVAYAADELHFQGVARDQDTALHVKPPNCPAVADLHLEWDFRTKSWLAEFVDGGLRGQKRRFAPADHTTTRWTKMQRSALPCTGSSFDEATRVEKKNAAKELVLLWCGSMVEGDHATFEAEFDLTDIDGHRLSHHPATR